MRSNNIYNDYISRVLTDTQVRVGHILKSNLHASLAILRAALSYELLNEEDDFHEQITSWKTRRKVFRDIDWLISEFESINDPVFNPESNDPDHDPFEYTPSDEIIKECIEFILAHDCYSSESNKREVKELFFKMEHGSETVFENMVKKEEQEEIMRKLKSVKPDVDVSPLNKLLNQIKTI